jgi:hypothetical protein
MTGSVIWTDLSVDGENVTVLSANTAEFGSNSKIDQPDPSGQPSGLSPTC